MTDFLVKRFIKNSTDVNDPAVRTAYGNWAGAVGIFCNVLLCAAKLAVGTLFGVVLLAGAKRLNKFYEFTNETLKTVGPILFVTAAGGVLGKVIAVSGMVETITANASILEAVGIFFPFLLSAILKTAQGSSTVALTTTAGIMAPLMDAMGLGTPVRAALTVSHANDSYFWVVTNFGEMKPEQGYKTQTLCTLLLGLSSMAGVFVLSLIFR